MRFVPQLNTVAMAIARPFTAAGNISLNTNQVTVRQIKHKCKGYKSWESSSQVYSKVFIHYIVMAIEKASSF